MPSISICVIAKNEEKNMSTFLHAIAKNMKNFSYELIIVDTGSKDRTVSIAKKYTKHVYSFAWINDFSAARNYSLAHASYDWVLVLDCDEHITELDLTGLETMMNNYPDAVGMLTRRNHYQMNNTDSIYTDEVERFFNKKDFHYEGIIHEQVCSLDGSPYRRIKIPLEVDHCGYAATEEELRQKAERNNMLLLKMLEHNPNDPYVYFQLGQSYNLLHDDERACYYYEKGLSFDVDPNAEYVQMMVIGYGYALLHLEKYDIALSFQNIYDDFAATADFICLMGLIYLRNGMIMPAMSEFLKATLTDKHNVEGANSFIPLFNMGCINEVLGEINSALSFYKRCGDFNPALERIAELEQKNDKK